MSYTTIMDVYNMIFDKYLSIDNDYTTDEATIVKNILIDIQNMYTTAFEEYDSYWTTIYEEEYGES